MTKEEEEAKNLEEEKEAGKKVTVNGREYKDYKEAAEKTAESYKEVQRTFTTKTQELADAQARLTELETAEKTREEEKTAAEEAAKAEEEKGKEGFDWDNPRTEIKKIYGDQITQLTAEVKKLQDDLDKMSTTGSRDAVDREIAQATADIPVLGEEGSEEREEVAKCLREWGGVIPDHILKVIEKQHPGVIRQARGNRVELAFYYLRHLDGTLEKHLQEEAQKSGGVSTLGSSVNAPTKSKLTKKEFLNLSEEEQDKLMKAEVKAKK